MKSLRTFALLFMLMPFLGVSSAASSPTGGHQEDLLPMASLFQNAKVLIAKPASGPAVILEANDNSAGRFPPSWRLAEIEGSGMTEPSETNRFAVWFGSISENDDGERTYDGSFRAATPLEVAAFENHLPVFPD